MDTSHDISVLNTLTATTLDSVKGYREAAENSDDAQHRQFFSEMAEERSRMAADLQQHVRAIGGDPEMESSTAGAAHRGWVDLKSASAGRSTPCRRTRTTSRPSSKPPCRTTSFPRPLAAGLSSASRRFARATTGPAR